MNLGQEKMIAGMEIGPVWKLRLNSLEQTISVSATSSLNLPSTPINHADLINQVEKNHSLNSSENEAACEICGACLPSLNAVQTKQSNRPNFLFIYESNIDSAPVLLSTGAADQLMIGILRELRIKRGITANVAKIVKTKPSRVAEEYFDGPNAEIFACLSCVKKQIEWIGPSIIISFGSSAAKSLLGFAIDLAMNDLRGQLHHYDETPLIVTHELSYLLHQPREKRGLWSDLCLAMNTTQIN